MDFLKNAAIPQSEEHFHLIIIISAISSAIFIPYLALTLGTSILSVWYNIIQKNKKNEVYRLSTHYVFDRVLHNKGIIFSFAILPALTILFVYVQIFQGTDSIIVGSTGFGFLLLFVGFALLYTYKYTYRLNEILEKIDKTEEGSITANITEYLSQNVSVNRKAGIYGVIILLVSAYLFLTAYSIAIDPHSWQESQSIFQTLISLKVWFRFTIFITISVGITGFGSLFFISTYRKFNIYESEYHRRISRFAIVSLLLCPFLLIAELMTIPIPTLSAGLYFFTGFTGLLLFIAGHFLYLQYTRGNSIAIKYGFFTFVTAVVVWVATDNIALQNATKKEAAKLAVAHGKMISELRSSMGISQVTFTGEGIYNAKCSACHLIDQRKVGPAYKDVLPKYSDDKAKLLAFVLNPQKINPDYPPMPAQGLKPAEADSVVTYLLSVVLKSTNK